MDDQMKALVVTMVLVLSGAAIAQPNGVDALRGQVREQIKKARLAKFAAVLALDLPTTQKLAVTFERFDHKMRPLHQKQRELVGRLRAELAASQPASAQLTALLDELAATREALHTIENERIRELRQALSPAQQARLVLEKARIQRELKKEVRDALALEPDEE
jgi:hypothetical protein